MLLGKFSVQKKCSSKGCDDEAEKVLILSDEDKSEMTVRFLCAPCAIYYESLFKDEMESN